MPYVGNSPASNFASVTKDTFSGDGSTTAFTLSKAATTNGVAVFVENVRQEPTTAYAVSGTTLTFTAAPVSASGNNIYVLHHNTPASTATHPSAQALTATSGTFTGAFTSVGIDDNADATTMTIDSSENVGIGNTSPSSQYMTRLVVGDGSGTEGITIYSGNDATGRLEFSDATSGDGRYAGGIVYEHNNNKLRFNTNGGNERMAIDSNGYVTKTQQVYVQAKGNGTRHTQTSANTDTALDFTEVTDNTNSFNTSGGIFTAPVAGRYFIHYYTSQRSNTSYIGLTVKHNGTLVARDYNELPNISADWVSQQVTIILNMAASDTVRPYMNTGGTNGQSLESDYRGCSIYLLG